MTKGLHKNSLRKGDNPHQWMIDDAKMGLIQTIRAEVERLKKKEIELMENSTKKYGDYPPSSDIMLVAYQNVLSFLDTLQEQPVCDNLPGFENEPNGIPGKDFVPVDWVETLANYGVWKIVKEQPVCEELKVEAEKYVGNQYGYELECQADLKDRIEHIRDFIAGAKWQREQMMKEALNGEIMTNGFYPYEPRVVAPFPSCPYEFGTEVKVIVIKED